MRRDDFLFLFFYLVVMRGKLGLEFLKNCRTGNQVSPLETMTKLTASDGRFHPLLVSTNSKATTVFGIDTSFFFVGMKMTMGSTIWPDQERGKGGGSNMGC